MDCKRPLDAGPRQLRLAEKKCCAVDDGTDTDQMILVVGDVSVQPCRKYFKALHRVISEAEAVPARRSSAMARPVRIDRWIRCGSDSTSGTRNKGSGRRL